MHRTTMTVALLTVAMLLAALVGMTHLVAPGAHAAVTAAGCCPM